MEHESQDDQELIGIEEDPVEVPVEEDEVPVTPAPLSPRVDPPAPEAVISRDIHMVPLPEVIPPSPPLSPVPSEDQSEEPTPEPLESEHAPFDTPSPASPLPPPPPPPAAAEQPLPFWMAATLTRDLDVATGRIYELRRILDTFLGGQAGGGARGSTPVMLGALTDIEMRGRVQIRQLPSSSTGLVSRGEVEPIVTRMMQEVRDLIRDRIQ